MARPIPIISSILPKNTFIIAILLMASIFSLVTFLCASHTKQKEEAFSKKKLATSRKNLLSSFNKANNISSKALMKIISWRKQVRHDEDEDYDHGCVNDGYELEEAVWKKTIIKGGKCRPIDFSGKIEYDNEGNLLPDHNKFIDEKKINKVVVS